VGQVKAVRHVSDSSQKVHQILRQSKKFNNNAKQNYVERFFFFPKLNNELSISLK